ncbi:MAG: CsbD family protein [Limisphaerales bacterium]
MSVLIAKGNWNIAKGKLKQKIARIFHDDLQFADGKEDELVGRIQKRSAQTGGEMEQVTDGCCTCKH